MGRFGSHADFVTPLASRGSRVVVLGIECGGTRTVALAADSALVPVLRLESGPANLRLVSDAHLIAQFQHLRDHLPQVSAVGVGMAGVRGAADIRRVAAVLEIVWPGLPHAVDHDLQSALAAADLGDRSRRNPVDGRVIVLSGTGSCCFGRGPRGRTAKVGGWGHWLGDRGSGYDIAHSALRQAIGELDRTGRWNAFGKAVLRQLQLNEPDDLIAWMQSAGKDAIARLATEVFAAASRGDAGPKAVLNDMSALLAVDAVACARRLMPSGGSVAFTLTGSVLLRQERFASSVRRQIRAEWPGARVTPLERESVWGAVSMALNALAASTPEAPKGRPTFSAKTERASEPGSADAEHPWVPESPRLSPTEQRNPRSKGLDRMPLSQALNCLWREEARGMRALASQHRQVEWLIRRVVRAFRNGGRLYYVGAGTSGRLGVLDASECPPTFRTPPDWVQGIIAGGPGALHSAVEGAEDDGPAGGRAIQCRGVGPQDVVVGIAASGRTPFVWGALAAARDGGAATALITFNPGLSFAGGWRPDCVIAPETGPEVVTGSTRLKAGTATKLILNAVTTLAMVRLVKVMDNLMVDLNASNAKLRDRALRIVTELSGADRESARVQLEARAGSVRAAVSELLRRRKQRSARLRHPVRQPAGVPLEFERPLR